MGFLAPVLPFIGPAIQTIGGLFGGGQSGQQKQSTDLMSKLVGDLRSKTSEFSPYASNYMKTSQGAFPQALNFWAPLLGGSRTAATSVMAPDISRINEQFDSILQGTKGARSGAGASIYAAAPYQKQAQIQSIFSNIRPQAAESVERIGTETGQLGNQTLQSIISALSQALGGGRSMQEQANQAYGQKAESMKLFGKGLSELLDLVNAKWGKKKA